VKAAPKITPAQALALYRIATDREATPAGIRSCQRAGYLTARRQITEAGRIAFAYDTTLYPDIKTIPSALVYQGVDEAPRIFVANPDGTFHCADCIPATVDVGAADVETWEEYSDGWIGPCVCSACQLSIPVYINGKEID